MGRINPWLVDDIYFTKGSLLPMPNSWCDLALTDGYANTGDWLGWIYAANAPWVHSAATGWLYAPNCPDNSGAWVYLPR